MMQQYEAESHIKRVVYQPGPAVFARIVHRVWVAATNQTMRLAVGNERPASFARHSQLRGMPVADARWMSELQYNHPAMR